METVTATSGILHRFKWFDLEDRDGFARWREAKLAAAARFNTAPIVEISELSNPSGAERGEIFRRCEAVNFAAYRVKSDESAQIGAELRGFAGAFGLQIAERHRSAGDDGIVALQPSAAPAKRGYIPYSARPMNWHTDGYYNPDDFRISAFVLHCVRPAGTGGENQILDPEIVYLRLREANPDYLRALMHPQAMTIPENREADGSLRPASVGPVFYGDPATGRLQMRYTARTRSITWRDDGPTHEAQAFLRNLLQQGDPLAVRLCLEAGQGILCNNILHNRTGFETDTDTPSNRLIYRVRFNNRIARSA